MKKLNLIVLMGGKSSEYDVSIVSGKEVVKNLDPKKYNISPILISKDGVSVKELDNPEVNFLHDNSKEIKNRKREGEISETLQISMLPRNTPAETVVFIAMQGKYGEDGTVQGMLELAGVKYTGSGVAASAIGMDKEMFRKLLSAHKIKVPDYFVVNKRKNINKLSSEKINYPVFVKPVNGGSSIGCSIATNDKEYRNALKKAFEYDVRVMVDEYVNGREITCAVLGNDNPIALPLVEIKPLKNRFFDYDSKYTESGAEEIVPAKLSKIITQKIQKEAIKIYKLLGARGFGRVDFLLNEKNIPVVLEINTIPGLTPNSLLPKAAKAYGLSYSQLLDKIISYAGQ